MFVAFSVLNFCARFVIGRSFHTCPLPSKIGCRRHCPFDRRGLGTDSGGTRAPRDGVGWEKVIFVAVSLTNNVQETIFGSRVSVDFLMSSGGNH